MNKKSNTTIITFIRSNITNIILHYNNNIYILLYNMNILYYNDSIHAIANIFYSKQHFHTLSHILKNTSIHKFD